MAGSWPLGEIELGRSGTPEPNIVFIKTVSLFFTQEMQGGVLTGTNVSTPTFSQALSWSFSARSSIDPTKRSPMRWLNVTSDRRPSLARGRKVVGEERKVEEWVRRHVRWTLELAREGRRGERGLSPESIRRQKARDQSRLHLRLEDNLDVQDERIKRSISLDRKALSSLPSSMDSNDGADQNEAKAFR